MILIIIVRIAGGLDAIINERVLVTEIDCGGVALPVQTAAGTDGEKLIVED